MGASYGHSTDSPTSTLAKRRQPRLCRAALLAGGPRRSITFEQLHDDLDELQLAAIDLPDGSPAWLYRYRGDQDTGTFVRVDAHADLARAKAQLERLLHLNDRDILWAASGPMPPRASFGPM